MTTPLAPYDAVFVVSYGGPTGPETVLPFMRNATAGRGIPDERLMEVSGHYQRFGGVSPINERNAELCDALRGELAARGADVPVAIGNRNWHPFITETWGDLVDAGVRRPLVLLTAAYASYSGCRQYREDIAQAAAGAGLDVVAFDKADPYYATDGFVAANAEAIIAAFDADGVGRDAHLVFVTHSIPDAMARAAGPDGGPDYVAQHLHVAERVAPLVSERIGREVTWDLAFCSRSGAPHIPWLEPDINDRLGELHAQGVTDVVVAPIGFINDHMEVVFDLDTEAKATATELGMRYTRAGTAGVHPGFVSAIVDRLEARAAEARGEVVDRTASWCSPGCCGSGRPGAPEAPCVAARAADGTPLS